ncbi:GNAT family N-acetyltransferase [Algoriphagus halophytocola]|uniref:GNAT family N-acetyltransferase n=1 Tax=Algoriphagus halophytocola TaxID=2991499 RepID=A0ABY6MJ94_9BACT|nr:GNAT family N-acetyltransferase [Algoriphagus sp. TR-M5]UZD22492.1 GNAT family N-acetyltransferase [Algoriphagus sp. TR-M5]
MITLIRTESSHPDFIKLVRLLDAYLAEKDGDEHEFYHQFNSIDSLQYVVICYEGEVAVACGAIKPFDESAMEVKRMFCLPEARGRDIASKVLNELEKWALELDFSACVLETGKRQVEAVRFYQKQGYIKTLNYGQYVGVENSLCFRKEMK